MSPRTPASIVAGTLVTMSLFGLMQAMVHEPESYPVPPPPTLDPFISPAALAAPPLMTRTPPPKPEPRKRPGPDSPAATINIESSPGAEEGLQLPPFVPGRTPAVFGPVIGSTKGSPGDGGGCFGGEAQPRLLVTPDYPRKARAAGIEGSVEVAFTVTPDGRVLDAEVVKATPRGEFEQATLRAVRQWRFEAATAECPRAAEARRETVSFRLEGVED